MVPGKVKSEVCKYRNQKDLIIVDYCSRFIELINFQDLARKALMFEFRNVFAYHALLYVQHTDNTHSFNSQEFHQFI